MFLTYKYRILPSKRQHQALSDISEYQRQLYNAALQERIDCYRKTGKSRTYFDQCKALTEVRADDPSGYGAIPLSSSRATIKNLGQAFDGFFSRIKRGGTPGFPRFKSRERWRGFGFNEFVGIRLKDSRLRFNGLPGSVRVHMHRPLPDGKIASCRFIQDAKGWFVCFQVEVTAVEKKVIATAVGIDVGLRVFAYQSDGIAIPSPNVARRVARSMRRRQRALARCKRGSNHRKKVKRELARLHAKISNTRRTWLHQQSARIANSYDLIAVEDLQVANMLKNEHLARSISDAGWATFTHMLSYKVEKTGGTFVKIDPKLTSQICSGCGEIVKKGLVDRVHNCPSCGLVLDRDHNAALNILKRAVLRPCEANVDAYVKRSRGNLKVVK